MSKQEPAGIKPPLICESFSPRPANIEYGCMRDLYLVFEELFLGQGNCLNSASGHSISVFDHHFFHMASITVPGVNRLYMRNEKEIILGLTEGFGYYEVGASRAKHLRSAYETLANPDEVWEDNPKARVKWVYVKRYATQPYPFSVALVTERSEESIIVPVSSFPCKGSDAKRWRNGRLIFPKNTIAAG
jgi:hypothetical protein